MGMYNLSKYDSILNIMHNFTSFKNIASLYIFDSY